MSDDAGHGKTTILEGPDGRLYEIPDDTLAMFAVPGERVLELRKRMSGGESDAHTLRDGPADTLRDDSADAVERGPSPGHLPPGHYPPGHLPPGHLPPGHASPGHAPPSFTLEHGAGGVVLNFYFHGAPGQPGGAPGGGSRPPQSDVVGYHMTFDETGIPVNHTEMLWGDYIDKQGNPAVGWHSHDPVTGNAQ